MGSVMLDLSGYELTPEEKEILHHPYVGGVIYFTRNYHDKAQLNELVRQTREASKQPLLLAVDHEGGRVQRFREGFSAIPSMGSLLEKGGALKKATRLAQSFGELMALEVLACGIDISFAPVLDVNGVSDVIGDRSFSAKPAEIESLATGFIGGMRQAGMKSTGKHFPGHGSVKEDSHVALPIDRRAADEVMGLDLGVFKNLIAQNQLDAIMPAHVIYESVDDLPAGFSSHWIKQVLRRELCFDGVVFSDDLAMHGALHLGAPADRAYKALQAGCDVALICNDREAAVHILDNLPNELGLVDAMSSMQSSAVGHLSWRRLLEQPRWQALQKELGDFYEQ